MSTNRLLVVDDEADLCGIIAKVAASCGYETSVTTDPVVFLERLRSWQPTHLILDLMMPGLDGIELMSRLAENGCSASIMIISGVDQKIIDTARRLGAERGLKIEGVFAKPIRIADLRTKLEDIKPDADWLTPQAVSEAMDRGEIVLFYQPKLDLANRSLTGFEALARWQHPVRGLIQPTRFLPVVEASPLIDRFTPYVIAAACQQIKRWQEDALTPDIAINISARNLNHRTNADRLENYCREQAVDPRRLIFELTESAAMSDAVQAMDILARLRLKGIRLSIDDFGTGYSSLVQLQRMPFSEIKIDHAFVAECAQSADSRVIVKTIVDLAHNLGMKAVAEGVETEGAAQYLSEIGCDQMQGYYVSPALPAADVLPWVKRRFGNIVRIGDPRSAGIVRL
ncbi:MAG TPA: EAL domain-containing response regulator [Candidatus Sulfotelmatobacter sp.]|nr:EAL domain-containing response regulator [Candidatus Sulfotelmatobacter sp.]